MSESSFTARDGSGSRHGFLALGLDWCRGGESEPLEDPVPEPEPAPTGECAREAAGDREPERERALEALERVGDGDGET
jgi:hypothetical protein